MADVLELSSLDFAWPQRQTWRGILASAYHVLLTRHHWTREQVRDYFAELGQRLAAPIREDMPSAIWMRALPDVFSPGSTSPNSRNQQMRAAVDTIVAWGLNLPQQPRWAPPASAIASTNGTADNALATAS